MKKLMFIAVSAFCAAALADGIASANIVGYVNKATDDGASSYYKYCTVGSMFSTVGDQTTFSLKDMKINADGCTDGGAYLDCKIQVIDPATSMVDQNKIYTYFGADDGADPATDPARWLYADESEIDEGDDVFPIGTAFLCDFNPNSKASLQFAGQVLSADSVAISTQNPSDLTEWYKYLYVVNPIPAALDFNEDVKINADGCTDGGAYLDCKLQVIDPATSMVDQDKIYTYFGADDGADPISDPARWLHADESELASGEEVVAVGAGFLCDFNPNSKASIVFANKVK